MNRKAAPRRDVLDIERVGDWGEITYRHRLGCGHTEIRKRPARAGTMACTACLADTELQQRLNGPATRIVEPPSPDDDWWLDPHATLSIDADVLQAGVAHRFGVDAANVHVTILGDTISHVTVILDAPTARRLAGQ